MICNDYLFFDWLETNGNILSMYNMYITVLKLFLYYIV